MTIATDAAQASWGRRLSLFAVLTLMLVLGALPANAGYDWCSVDPTITLERSGGNVAHAMDIQVMVPRSALPMKGTARLEVILPSNVIGTEVLNTSTPLFNIKTVFGHNRALAGETFKVKIRLKMPATKTDYPVRLVIINQDSEQRIAIATGRASKVLTLTVNSMDLRKVVEDMR
jgi:hypothetical protein